MSSYYGKELHISIFGQSHAECVGVTIDGLPAGERIDEDALAAFMQRRAPGRMEETTARKESDEVKILCGLYNGLTCGAPISAIIQNSDRRSKDYDNLRDIPRPGHADLTAHIKYGGFQDVRGGGHFSGRLTAPLCIAGGICAQILSRRGVEIAAHILSIAEISDRSFNPMGESKEELTRLKNAAFPVLDASSGNMMREAIVAAKRDGDSVGGIVECFAVGFPAGVGSPIFDGLESKISAAAFAIPAVKGIEFGAGFAASAMRGSSHNDEIAIDGGKIITRTNNAGGILGGISNGMPIIFRVAFKPTASILREQKSVSLSKMREKTLQITGRHDPCVVTRAVPVVEAAAAVALLDAMLERGAETI